MASTDLQQRNAAPFSPVTVVALVVTGFAAFLAMLYFIGAGDTGPRKGGTAHVATDGLNGYAAFAGLLEADGIDVRRVRGGSALETGDLLILTPGANTPAEEIAAALETRRYAGPTLLIVPKWTAIDLPENLSDEDRERVRGDWVRLIAPQIPKWTRELPPPLAFEANIAPAGRSGRADDATFSGLGITGELPTAVVAFAKANADHEPLIVDASGRALAFDVLGDPNSEYYADAQRLVIVVEPDLLNNYGLSDPRRAQLALALVDEAGYGEVDAAVFDLSLAGMGAATNLLTLAFQPPFLAATLCLVLALIVVGWRAFLRFGPTAVPSRELAYGKTHLVENGAGLIVRAGRLRLLARPYAELVERRLARMLGLAKPDRDAIDQALERRLPGEPAFSATADRIERARNPADILREARTLDRMTRKLAP